MTSSGTVVKLTPSAWQCPFNASRPWTNRARGQKQLLAPEPAKAALAVWMKTLATLAIA